MLTSWNRKTIISLVAFLVIFALFAFLRLYRLDQRIIFEWDQERDAFVIRDILINHKLTLLGPRVVNTHGFFLAPYYTYLLVPFYLLSSLHPRAMMYLIITVTLIFFVATYFIIRRLWSEKHALVFLAFWAINFVLIDYDTIAWNVLLVPVGIVLVWFLLQQLVQTNHWKYWALLGATLGLFLNFHFQFIFLIFFALCFAFFNREQLFQIEEQTEQMAEREGSRHARSVSSSEHWREGQRRQNLDYSALVWKLTLFATSFILIFTPLFLFDLRHQFLNTKLLFSFFLDNPDKLAHEYFSWIPVLTNIFQPLTVIRNSTLTLLLYGFCTAGTVYFVKRNKGTHRSFYQSMLLLLIATPLFFMVYGKRPSEYYFLFLYPYLYILFSDLLLALPAILNVGNNKAQQVAPTFATTPAGKERKAKNVDERKWRAWLPSVFMSTTPTSSMHFRTDAFEPTSLTESGNNALILPLIIISLLTFLNANEIYKVLHLNNLSLLAPKDHAVRELKKYTEGRKINVSIDAERGRGAGYAYLVEYYQIKQTSNPKDTLVEIVVPPKEGTIDVGGNIGLKIPWMRE